MLLMLSLVALSICLDLDMLLGAFAAGVITQLLLSGASPADRRSSTRKLEALAFGFLVPVFFINTGVTFDLDALLASRRRSCLLPVFVLLLLVVRGAVGTAARTAGVGRRRQAAPSSCSAPPACRSSSR